MRRFNGLLFVMLIAFTLVSSAARAQGTPAQSIDVAAAAATEAPGPSVGETSDIGFDGVALLAVLFLGCLLGMFAMMLRIRLLNGDLEDARLNEVRLIHEREQLRRYCSQLQDSVAWTREVAASLIAASWQPVDKERLELIAGRKTISDIASPSA